MKRAKEMRDVFGIKPAPDRPSWWKTFLKAHWGEVAGMDVRIQNLYHEGERYVQGVWASSRKANETAPRSLRESSEIPSTTLDHISESPHAGATGLEHLPTTAERLVGADHSSSRT